MLPITKVVLYKHGVGYFERRGKVSGDAELDLHFKAPEMNDVLKSLTLLDMGGGLVSSISYESTKPLEKQLEDIAIRLPEQNALTGLLAQLAGAAVEVEVGSTRISGVIAGTETVARRADGETIWVSYLTLLVDGTSVRTVQLMDLRSMTFLDPSLRRDLKHLLDTLISSKKKDLKRLTIFARGEGEREIVASYIVETPVWKTSYRLLVGDAETLIQGWALVDNTQDEDWQDVSLTLVAGLPVSFVHDLYSPRYRRRPVVRVQEEEAYAPPVLEEGLGEGYSEEGRTEDHAFHEPPVPRQASAARFGPPVLAAPMMVAQPPAPPRISKAEAVKRSVRVETLAAEAGDLFEYTIANPVTVKRSQSALVPILQSKVEGRRLAIYNPEVRAKNPMSAVRLKNTTGMTLEGGPVTVFDGETYAGESMLETLKPGDERLVPYSVELGCVVGTENEAKLQDVHHVKLVAGNLTVHRYRLERATYVVRNKLDRPIDLLLDHRFKPGFALVDTDKPFETTESFYRFRLEVPAGTTKKLLVQERGDVFESFHVGTVDRERLVLFVSKRYIDEPTREALERVVEANEKLASLDYWVSEREREIEQVFQNQQRLRENLAALSASEDEKRLRERYVAQLNGEEDRLATMREEIRNWKDQREQVRKEVASLIKGLAYEAKL